MGRRKINVTPPAVSDLDRFWKLMTTPLCNVTDEDLVWASHQDEMNSWLSKQVWISEIKRREEKTTQEKQWFTH